MCTWFDKPPILLTRGERLRRTLDCGVRTGVVGNQIHDVHLLYDRINRWACVCQGQSRSNAQRMSLYVQRRAMESEARDTD